MLLMIPASPDRSICGLIFARKPKHIVHALARLDRLRQEPAVNVLFLLKEIL